MDAECEQPPARRAVLAALGAAGVLGGTALTACSASSATSGSPAARASAGGPLAQVSDIPVGQAIVVPGSDGRPVVLCQPTKGVVVAHSAVCTHAGCTVAPAGGELLRCPCHGSTFNASTGQNSGGPAPSPLPAVPVTIRAGSVLSG